MAREWAYEICVSVPTSEWQMLHDWCLQSLPILHAIPSEQTWTWQTNQKLNHSDPNQFHYKFFCDDPQMATCVALTWNGIQN